MKIGDEVYVHGYVDEIRKDVVIIRNEGGYFGTVEDEIISVKIKGLYKDYREPSVTIEDTPQTETQMKTQNSNLTFKTLEYCDICDHKGCEECIANALDEHCIPSQFKKQIEDECAKEYEELGLKELKELIEADRKTEPTISKMEQVDKDINVRSKDKPNCEECKHFHENAVMYLDQCDFCFKDCKYEPKDEPQIVGKHADAITIDESRLTAKCLNCANGGSYKCSKCDGEMYYKYDKDEPQTDCSWK